MEYNRFSQAVSVFHGKALPEEGVVAGYAELISHYELKVPLPDRLALISQKHRRYETDEWQVFTPRHAPKHTLGDQLTFALKYEGVDLGILKALFEKVGAEAVSELVRNEPTGQYSRKIWFLYEWLLVTQLNIPDLSRGNFVDLLDEKLQYPGPAEVVKRQRIRNNLPGVRNFCPLVRKTPKLEAYQKLQLRDRIRETLGSIHSDVMARTAAFLLLKDSKASYAIEGEQPLQNRVQRWGKAIGQAGQKPLTKEELLRLQQLVIEDTRFIKLGWRTNGGFVGEHDRRHGTPIPDHISAKPEDLQLLLDGLIETNQKLESADYNAVLAAAMLGFGFVFIHPFVDGNGRIHRYLFHHVLARKDYVPRGFVFPVSAVILERLDEYRQILEAYAHPRLELTEWKPTQDHNVAVLNETLDLYRYFDATKQAEFLYSCVQQTVEHTIPEEVAYLEKYDLMKTWIDLHFDMPDKVVALLIRFLDQGKGRLSSRARTKEFAALEENEVGAIEKKYAEVFRS